MKGRLIRNKITKDTLLDFEKISNGKGVYHLTLQNNGETVAYLDDATQEEIEPGDTLIVESPVAIINTNFPIIFKYQQGKQNSMIMSYIVAVDCQE